MFIGKNLVPSTRLYISQRISLTPQTALPWDLMVTFLNIFSQHNNTDNTKVLPRFLSATEKLLKECSLEGRLLGFEGDKNQIAINENKKKYHTLYGFLLRSI